MSSKKNVEVLSNRDTTRCTVKQNDVALHYFVDDLPGAHIPASRLKNILENLQRGHSITSGALMYLQKQKLLALYHLVTGCSTFDEFNKTAQAEQIKRKQESEALKRKRETEQQAKEAARQAKIKLTQKKAHAARLALEQDPRYIAKIKNQNLRARFDLDQFIEKHCFTRLMDILRRLDAGKRLSEQDVLWLSTHGDDYYTEKVRSAFHYIEAEFFVAEFKKTQSLWMAVNASSHYRKCNKASLAETLLNTIDINTLKSLKLKSALYTTLGGVKRDLKQLKAALELGEKAHVLMNQDFRPCTLLGALHMELGHYIKGQEWYTKAIERGASERAIDGDLRSIFMRSDKKQQDEMRAYLINLDAERYRWARKRSI